MSIFGSPAIQKDSSPFDLLLSLNYNNAVHAMYSGIDWLYTSVENIYAYDFKITYFWLLDSIFDESVDYFLNTYIDMSLYSAPLQLIWVCLLDTYLGNQIINFSIPDEWVKGFICSQNAALFVINHPECAEYCNQIYDYYIINLITDTSVSAISYLDQKQLLTPIMLFPQFLFILFYIFMFVSVFFSYFTSSSKEESTIDADYLTASLTVESEKEVGSIDDLVMPAIIFAYTFGWFFYIYCWNILCVIPELVLIFFFFPLLYYTIGNTPTFLLYDFGILYNCYLRGIAPTPNIIFELMYDYIAVIAFYVRILTQGVRLALMIFTYAAMHDFVVYESITFQLIVHGNESIWEDLANLDSSVSSFTYFMLVGLPFHITNWIYELVHTFFVVTGQLVAYCAMIFWLFLFLFTFFVIEKQESYFEERRNFRREYLEKIKKINKNNKG